MYSHIPQKHNTRTFLGVDMHVRQTSGSFGTVRNHHGLLQRIGRVTQIVTGVQRRDGAVCTCVEQAQRHQRKALIFYIDLLSKGVQRCRCLPSVELRSFPHNTNMNPSCPWLASTDKPPSHKSFQTTQTTPMIETIPTTQNINTVDFP